MGQKIILEFEEINILPENMFQKENYPSNGLYVVNDGIARFLVSVSDSPQIFSMPITLEELQKYSVYKTEEEYPVITKDEKNSSEGWVSAKALVEIITTLKG
ncbi:MAG: hypothetical protein H6Q13_3230 [Bacteroidetes bacterium]|nr:hypothetical protein [Bacteroidota bacterium]